MFVFECDGAESVRTMDVLAVKADVERGWLRNSIVKGGNFDIFPRPRGKLIKN